MKAFQKQERYNFRGKGLRTFVLMLSLLTTTATTYAEARGTIVCVREEEGLSSQFNRAATRLYEDHEDGVEDLVNGAIGILREGPLVGWIVGRLEQFSQVIRDENILEIKNDNTKPLRVLLKNQSTEDVTELGVVSACTTKQFLLDRAALYNSYVVQGTLGFGRSDTSEPLNRRNRKVTVVFLRDTIGTTAVVKKY